MKTILIYSGILLFTIVVAGFGVSGCVKWKAEARRLKAQQERSNAVIDSLRNRAAYDCDQKIQEAIKSLSYETTPNRPYKPDFLR
ncbi:hypothetical protein [Runella sp.]|uniref:hypothetical protein n=1 Tax=Runella sp. TaxID=1960881 RepID=UPI003019F14E